MSDLIDRDALMKEFQTFVRRSNNHDYALVPTWNDAVSLVGSMPSAEPERKKGKWIDYDAEDINDYPIEAWQSCRCTSCGKWHTTPYKYNFDQYPFCPNCGADMRGE